MTDREELTRQASAMVESLRERASKAEELRRIPRETVDELQSSGLIRVAQPARFGGMGMDFDVAFDIAAELGRGCGSSAWCYSVWASHNWLLGMFPEETQREVWADSPEVLTSTSFNPAGGKVSLAEGGYRVSGRWDFASGCDEAGWVLLVGNGPEGLLWLLLPRRDYAIEDTWFVSGLRGTGSKDVVIEDVFVPQRHTLQVAEIREARTPGRDLHDTANYRIPLRSLLSFTLVAPVLGMAQGMLEAFEANTLRGLASRRANRLMEIPGLQMRLAEASAEIRAAGLLMRHDCRELFARARRGEMPTLEERARYRLDQSYVARLCARAVDRLFAASGGHALMDSSPMQRFHRDVHAAANHISLSWDATAIQYGGILLGVEVREPDL